MKKWLFDKIKLFIVGIIVTLGFVAYIFSTELEWLWLAALGGFIVSFWGVWVGISLAKERYPAVHMMKKPKKNRIETVG